MWLLTMYGLKKSNVKNSIDILKLKLSFITIL